MRRCLALVLALVMLSAAGASAGEIKIAWYGQSMFLLVTPNGKRIVFDPHNIENYRIKPMKADLVLMSHFHTDHTQEVVIENAKDAIKRNALKKGGPNGLLTDWNVVDEKHFNNEVRLQTLTTRGPGDKVVGPYHDEVNGLERGKNGAWIVDIDGLRIVHLGDLGHMLTKDQVKKLGPVDVLMLPVGGVYTLNGLVAFKVMQQVKPRRTTIPMHYGTIVYGDLLPVSYFTDECKEEGVPVTRSKGGWLKIDTKAEAPKQADVTVMDYNGAPIELKPKKK